VRPLRYRRASERTALPPRTVSSAHARRPGSSSGRRHHRCGTAPGSHRLRWAVRRPVGQSGGGRCRSRPAVPPGLARDARSLSQSAGHYGRLFAGGATARRCGGQAVRRPGGAAARRCGGQAVRRPAGASAGREAPPSHTWRGPQPILYSTGGPAQHRHAGTGPGDDPFRRSNAVCGGRRYQSRRWRRGYPRAHVAASAPGARPADIPRVRGRPGAPGRGRPWRYPGGAALRWRRRSARQAHPQAERAAAAAPAVPAGHPAR
jgi:hypothetical protein